jgi:hypothetical protein
MTENKKEPKSAISKIKKISLVIIALYVLYVIAGFWIVPPLIKPMVEKELSSQLGRTVTIEEIKINPLALSSTTTNLTVHEIDGDPFAGFKELLVNAELSSIIRLAVTFKEIRLQAPFGIIKILPDKSLNISDILTRFSQPEQAPDQKAELIPAVISKLQVQDGSLAALNLSEKEPVKETLHPITFTLTNLSTLKEREGAFKFMGIGPSGGNYEIDGQLTVDPLRVRGSFSTTGTNLIRFWKHLKNHVSFQIIKGTTATSGNYLLELVDGAFQARLQNGAFELKDFELTEKGKDKVLISVPTISVQGISADVKAREIVVEGVKTADARIESWLASDGTFKLQSIFLPDLEKLMKMKKTSSSESKADTGRPWHGTIHKIEVINWGAAIEDHTLAKPARITADNITVSIDELGNKKNSKAKVSLALQLNQAGTIRVDGSAGMSPLSADLKVVLDKIALKSFQLYVDAAVNAEIGAGTTSATGRLLYQGKEGRPQISYKGELSLDGFKVVDRVRTEDFITLDQLKVSDIALALHPNRLHVADVLINKPHARVTIDQNGTVNVVQAFTPVKKEDGKGKKNLLQRVVKFLILQMKGPMPMSVDLVELHDFSTDFIDGSMTPPYSTHLDISNGTMKGLSSDPLSRADFEIAGAIDQSAPLKSSGEMNPLNAMHYTYVDLSLEDFELKPVSPYSGKFVGYKIAEGTLHLRLKYSVDESALTGDNIIFIDQLTLGDRVESPDAINLPVPLGVALLKDANGRIALQVPVKGNVKDPQFDFGHAITSGLTGTLDDVGSEPFSTITEIDGIKGEELRFIGFAFGLSELGPGAMHKLNALAKFLKERPSLILTIEGTADRQMDWAKVSGKPIKKEEPGSSQKAAEAQHLDLSEDQDIDDMQLEKLAHARATQVKDYLVQKGTVTPERVQLKPVKIISTTSKEYGYAELYLSVQ